MASRWVRVKYAENTLPREPGCYAIFVGGMLLYVGSAKNLRQRFRLHQIGIGRINCVAVGCNPQSVTIAYRLSVKFGDWAMVEIRLLRRLRPPVNSHHNGGKRVADYLFRGSF